MDDKLTFTAYAVNILKISKKTLLNQPIEEIDEIKIIEDFIQAYSYTETEQSV
jgi:hypothetical protein